MKKLLLLLIICVSLISCNDTSTYKVYNGRIVSYQQNYLFLDDILVKTDNGNFISVTSSSQFDGVEPILVRYYFANKAHAKITVRYSDGCTPEIYSIKEIK